MAKISRRDLKRNELAETMNRGVDYVSVGALTKHVHAIDLSLRFALQ